jgi:hypothetical protein
VVQKIRTDRRTISADRSPLPITAMSLRFNSNARS